MSGLFDNAVGSIRVGVQDYRSTEPHRHISAVRNYYAGILLLAKEVLVRRFPNEDPDKLIAANLKPVAGPNGTVNFQPATRNTVDFATIGRRFDDLGIAFDHSLLKGLNQIRNDVEHKFSPLTRQAIVEAIARGFPAAGQLFRLIDEDPAAALGAEWSEMLETRELFEAELVACAATLEDLEWLSPTVAAEAPRCSDCGSSLVRQLDAANTDQESAEPACRACGAKPDIDELVEAMVAEALGFEAYSRVKDTGEDGPVHDCGECGRATYIDFEDRCAACGHSVGPHEGCAVCGAAIPLAELLADPGTLLCGYHRHVMSKDD